MDKRKEKAAKRIQDTYGVHVEVTEDGEYVVATLGGSWTAHDAEKLAKQTARDFEEDE